MNNDNDNSNENQIAPDWGPIRRQWEAPLLTAKGILNLEKPLYLNGTDYDKGPDNYWLTVSQFLFDPALSKAHSQTGARPWWKDV